MASFQSQFGGLGQTLLTRRDQLAEQGGPDATAATGRPVARRTILSSQGVSRPTREMRRVVEMTARNGGRCWAVPRARPAPHAPSKASADTSRHTHHEQPHPRTLHPSTSAYETSNEAGLLQKPTRIDAHRHLRAHHADERAFGCPPQDLSVLAQGALAPDDRARARRGWQPVQAGPSPWDVSSSARSVPKPEPRESNSSPRSARTSRQLSRNATPSSDSGRPPREAFNTTNHWSVTASAGRSRGNCAPRWKPRQDRHA